MLVYDRLHAELEDKKEDFRRHAAEQEAERSFYLKVLRQLEKTPSADIASRLAEVEDAGAIPASELDAQRAFRYPFTPRWQNHEQARGWAEDVLANRTTFAADGSQLYVEKETSLPVGAIQIGWFENPHSADGKYVKDVLFRILTPSDLLADQEEPMRPETRVGEERFHAEVAKAEDFLRAKKGWRERNERMPLAFFDGTLLVSFSLPRTSLQKSFIDALVRLVKLSRETEVPVIGYIDHSFARDLLTLLKNFSGERPDNTTLFDTAVLHRETAEADKILQMWGERTCFCYSKRRGMDAFLDTETGRPLVGFSYLQTTSDAAPARLDIPAWIYEKGLLDELLDVVRAECVIGLGYPYALETADQTAVISGSDREVFFRALQDLSTREKLGFNVTRKQTSKNRRR